jgi:hypothetical protein
MWNKFILVLPYFGSPFVNRRLMTGTHFRFLPSSSPALNTEPTCSATAQFGKRRLRHYTTNQRCNIIGVLDIMREANRALYVQWYPRELRAVICLLGSFTQDPPLPTLLGPVSLLRRSGVGVRGAYQPRLWASYTVNCIGHLCLCLYPVPFYPTSNMVASPIKQLLLTYMWLKTHVCKLNFWLI